MADGGGGTGAEHEGGPVSGIDIDDSSHHHHTQGNFEPLLTEHSFQCRTGHVLNVVISFGSRRATEGFLFEVEDDNFKTYHTFLPLLSAMVDVRLSTLKLDPRDHESKSVMAKTLLHQLKLENSKMDGRKLKVLFDPLSIPSSRKLRSPINKTKMGQSRKKKVVEQKWAAAVPTTNTQPGTSASDAGSSWASELEHLTSTTPVAMETPPSPLAVKPQEQSSPRAAASQSSSTAPKQPIKPIQSEQPLSSRKSLPDKDKKLTPRDPPLEAVSRPQTPTKVASRPTTPTAAKVLSPPISSPKATTPAPPPTSDAHTPPPSSTPLPPPETQPSPAPTPRVGDVAAATAPAAPVVVAEAASPPSSPSPQPPPPLPPPPVAVVTSPRVALLKQVKYLGGSGGERHEASRFEVTLLEQEGSDAISLSAVDQADPAAAVYELTVTDGNLRALYQYDTLESLPLLQKAELCTMILDRVDIERITEGGARKHLVLHRTGRHVPRRVAVSERRKILRFVQLSRRDGVNRGDAASSQASSRIGPRDSMSSSSLDSREVSDVFGSSGYSVASEADGATLVEEGEGGEEGGEESAEEVMPEGRRYYELFVRAKPFGDLRVVVVTMYDDDDVDGHGSPGIRIVGEEVKGQGGPPVVVARVKEEDLALLGCHIYRDLTLDQRVEVCEKLYGFLEVVTAGGGGSGGRVQKLVVNITAPSRAVTVLTRGATLCSPFACVVVFKEEEEGGRLTVEAEDVFDPSRRQTLAISATDLAEISGSSSTKFSQLSTAGKAALCEEVLSCLELRVEEDGVGRALLLTPPGRPAGSYKTVTFIRSVAEPVMLGTLPPPHRRMSVGQQQLRRRRRRRRGRGGGNSRTAGEEEGGTQQGQEEQEEEEEKEEAPPRRASILLNKCRVFGGHHTLVITILEVPPAGVVRAYDPQSGEAQYLVFDADLLRALGSPTGLFGRLAPTQKANVCEQIFDSLVLLGEDGGGGGGGGGGGKGRAAWRLAVQVPDGHEAVAEMMGSRAEAMLVQREVKTRGQEGGEEVVMTLAVFNAEETAVVVAKCGVTEYRQVLSYADMDDLGCHDYSYLDRDEKVQLANKILDSVKLSSLVGGNREGGGGGAELTPDLHDFIVTHFSPSSTVGQATAAGTTAGSSVVKLGVSREMMGGRGYAVTLRQGGLGPPAVLDFSDTQHGEYGFSVPLTDRDCQAMGYRSVHHALRAENLQGAVPRLVDGVEARVVVLSNGPLLAAFPRSIARLVVEEERAKIRYMFVQDDHPIRDKVYDISVIVEGPSQLRVQADEQGDGGGGGDEVLELVLSGTQLAMLVRGGKLSEAIVTEEKRQAVGKKLLDGLDVVGGVLKFGFRRAAKKDVVASERADVVTVPVAKRPLVKKYLDAMRLLDGEQEVVVVTGKRGEAEESSDEGSSIAGGAAEPATTADDNKEEEQEEGKERCAPTRAVVRSAYEMLGIKGNYILDPYAEVLSHKRSSIGRFRNKGLKYGKLSYVSYWEAKVAGVLDYFSCERSLRKAISIVRQTQRHVHVSNKEAFCALAATDGSLAEACGKLQHVEFYKEIQLVGKIINLDRYKKLIVTDGSGHNHSKNHTSASPSRLRMSGRLSSITSSLPSDGHQNNSSSAAPATAPPSSNLLGTIRRVSVNPPPPSHRRASTAGGTTTSSSRTNKGGQRGCIMDITRSDFESLFAGGDSMGAPYPRISDDVAVALRESAEHERPSSAATAARLSFIAATPAGGKGDGGRVIGGHGNAITSSPSGKAPSRRMQRRLLDSTVLSQKQTDLDELRRLAANVKERQQTFPTPWKQRPYTSTGACRARVQTSPCLGADQYQCSILLASGLMPQPLGKGGNVSR